MSHPPDVRGLIPRIERQQSHYDFLWAVRPPVVMVNLIHGARIAAFDDVFFPNKTDVILTTTISDEKLATYTFQDELQIIQELEPDYVIPFDLPVYADMSASERQRNVELIASRTQDMEALLSLPDDPTDIKVQRAADILDMSPEDVSSLPDSTILPLIKGHNPIERQPLFEVAVEINAPCIAKYGVQYMTVGGNKQYPQLVSDLETINDESDGFPTLVIGLCSPSGMFSLEGVPENVIAAAGTNQWVSCVEPHLKSPSEMRESYHSLSSQVAETLNVPISRTPRSDDICDEPNSEFSSITSRSVSEDLTPTNTGAAGDPEYGFGQRKRPEDAASALEAGLKGAIDSSDE